MRRNKISPLLLVIMFMTFPIIIILMTHHITLSETLSSMDSGALGKTYTMISIPEGQLTPETLYEAVAHLPASIGVYSDYETEDEIKVRAIYFSKSYVTIPMLSGRFFLHSDFQENNYCAVIGKGLASLTEQTGENQYISVGACKFQVLSVIGYEQDTVWDRTVFINGYIQPMVFNTKLYTLDFFSGDSQALTTELLNDLQQETGISGEMLSGSQSFMSGFLPRVLYARWFIVVLLCNAISIILLSLEWLRGKKIEFCIKRLLGATTGKLIGNLCLQYGIMLLTAFALSTTYCTVFYPAYINSLGIGFLLFLPLVFTFIMGTAWLLLKTPIREGLN
jgi:hypothetical protein